MNIKKKKKIEKLVDIGTILTNLFPKGLMNIGWMFFDNSESKVAVFYRLLYMKKYCRTVKGILFVGKNTNIKNHSNLSIGANVSIHSFNYIDAHGGITIGDNVSIANHCTLISSDHTWEDAETPIKYNEITKKPISIDSDVWIAAGCRILGNVNIESRTVIGAGAVVNKSLTGNSVYVGVPAKKVKSINEQGVKL